jgi:hypothetical protein
LELSHEHPGIDTVYGDASTKVEKVRRNALAVLRPPPRGCMREVPATARDILKALVSLARFARATGVIKIDPTVELIAPPMKASDGYLTWTSRRSQATSRCRRWRSTSRSAIGGPGRSGRRRSSSSTAKPWPGERNEPIGLQTFWAKFTNTADCRGKSMAEKEGGTLRKSSTHPTRSIVLNLIGPC